MMTGAGRFLGIYLLSFAAGAVFAGDLFVATEDPKASDSNPGSKDAPFKTISAAVAKVQPGDTVIVRPGVYRECVSLRVSGRQGAPIALTSEEPYKAVICGSDVIESLKDEGGGLWSFEGKDLKPGPSQMDFWVFVDGAPLERMAPDNSVIGDKKEKSNAKESLLPGSFCLDCESKRVYLMAPENLDVKKAKVEFARREGLIRPFDMHANSKPEDFPMLDDIHIKGFTLIHNAGWFRGRSALMMTGRRWLVENNRILWSTFQGLNMKHCNGAVVRNNEISWCGDMAIGGSFCANMLVEGGRYLCNNWRRIDPSWEGGGSKWCFSVDSRIKGGEWAYNFGPGVWFDVANGNCVIEGNVGHDNEWGAAFSEISWGFIFRDNVNFNNGPLVVGESPCTLLRHNVSFNNELGIRMRGDFRRWTALEYGRDNDWAKSLDRNCAELSKIPDISPMRVEQWGADFLKFWIAPKAHILNDCAIWENLVFDNAEGIWEHREYGKPSERDPFINNFSDYNIFWSSNPSKLFVHSAGCYEGLEQWRKASGRDEHSVLANPRDPKTSLPDWAESKRKYWEAFYRPYSELRSMKLGLVPGPASLVAKGRILRSKEATQIRLSDPRIKAVLFELDGRKVLGLWTTMMAERRYLSVKTASSEALVEDAYLNKKTKELLDGRLELCASFLPTYVYDVGDKIEELPSSSLVAQPFNQPGEAVPLVAKLVNPKDAEADAQASFTASSGFKLEPASISKKLKPGETAEIKLQAVPDGSVRKGVARVRMQADVSGSSVSRSSFFSIGEGSGRIPKLSKPLKLDGSLEEWGDIASSRVPLGLISEGSQVCSGDAKLWKGAKDASAKIYAAWTQDKLYVAVAVTDDSIVAAPGASDPWNFDCVEFFIDGRSPEMQWQKDRTDGTYQIGVSAPDADGKSTSRTYGSSLKGYKSVAKRTADGYLVELMIPLTLENFPAGLWQAGRPVKMSVLVNDKDDSDAQERKYAIGWAFSPKGANFCDTSGWATLTLDE